MDTITRLSPHELVAVAETGIPPALSEIIDIDIDTFPEENSPPPQDTHASTSTRLTHLGHHPSQPPVR